MQSFLERVGLGKLWNASSELKFGHEIDLRGTGRLNSSERLVGNIADLTQLAQAKFNLTGSSAGSRNSSSGFSE